MRCSFGNNLLLTSHCYCVANAAPFDAPCAYWQLGRVREEAFAPGINGALDTTGLKGGTNPAYAL